MLRRGIKSITPIRSTAGWTSGPFTVVDAKIVCNIKLQDDYDITSESDDKEVGCKPT